MILPSRHRPLAGRVAWITGGTSGIGKACALELARQGADIALGGLPPATALPGAAYCDTPGEDADRDLRESIEAEHVRAFIRPFDVRSTESLRSFFTATVEALGAPTILVNAAGVSAQQSLREATEETWTGVLDINLSGAFRCTKIFLDCLPEGVSGRIVNIGSTASSAGYAGYAAYCASKHGLLGLTRAVAHETAAIGVTCNLVEPGYVLTGMMRMGSQIRALQAGKGATAEDDMRQIASANPQGRLITPEEVAGLVAYLCSDIAAGITGEAIRIAGGANW